ncbi:MAG TPA: iron-sulfur cluster assembly scaffold protein, partial [Steroidobacteraceae bacterium]
MKYNELTLHYFETAPGAGVLTGPDVYRGAAGRREQGTWVQFDVQVSGGIIQAARFLAFGCPHTIAVSAWVA